MSIVFACEKFSDYTYGHRFDVCNDHMSLKGIFHKPLSKAPARIERFSLRLQRYNFYMHYVRGKLLYVPDTLSRASLQEDKSEIPEGDLESYVHSIIFNMPISESRFLEFQEETTNDKVLQILSESNNEGMTIK